MGEHRELHFYLDLPHDFYAKRSSKTNLPASPTSGSSAQTLSGPDHALVSTWGRIRECSSEHDQKNSGCHAGQDFCGAGAGAESQPARGV